MKISYLTFLTEVWDGTPIGNKIVGSVRDVKAGRADVPYSEHGVVFPTHDKNVEVQFSPFSNHDGTPYEIGKVERVQIIRWRLQATGRTMHGSPQLGDIETALKIGAAEVPKSHHVRMDSALRYLNSAAYFEAINKAWKFKKYNPDGTRA